MVGNIKWEKGMDKIMREGPEREADDNKEAVRDWRGDPSTG